MATPNVRKSYYPSYEGILDRIILFYNLFPTPEIWALDYFTSKFVLVTFFHSTIQIMKNRSCLFVLCLLLFTVTTFAQSSQNPKKSSNPTTASETTSISFETKVYLENSSGPEVVNIEVKEGTKEIMIEIIGELHIGRVDITLYDPNSKKNGNFSIVAGSPTGSRRMASGSMNKTLREPLTGTWTVKIKPEAGIGDVRVRSYLIE